MEQRSINHHEAKEIRQALKAAGVQPSASRMAIASFVWNTDTHPTAEEVKDRVEQNFPTVSLATVYNTLKLFVEKGLLKEVQDSSQRSVRYDCNTTPHFHFVDELTGRLIDLEPAVLRITPDFSRLGKEFKIREIEVTLRGQRLSDQTKNKKGESKK